MYTQRKISAETDLSRRKILARLGLAAVGVYVGPEVFTLSQARAASGSSSSPASVPTPPTPPTEPSNVEDIEKNEQESDRCHGAAENNGNAVPTISRNDNENALAAVDAGYAKPLSQIWPDIATEYDGRIVAIEFTGYRWRPRYRLRAVSRSGRLETVIVSARTGDIVRIVGC